MKQKHNPLTQKISNRLLADSIIGVLILITPFIFYSYEQFPKEPTFETAFFTLTTTYYGYINTAVWVFMGKFVPLYICLVWFFTCKYWWKYAILVPIGMYLGQIIIYFNNEIKFKDEMDWNFILPIVIGVGILLGFIRHKLSSKIDLLTIREILKQETKPIKKPHENE